jgi:hypothetical protein
VSDRLTPILSAIRARVEGLGLTLAGVAAPVLIREAAVRRQTMDPASMITVAKSQTAEQTSRRRFGLWQTRYVVDVVIHTPAGEPDADQGEAARNRDTLVDAFKKPPLPGAPDVFDLGARAADWLKPGDGSQWKWQAMQIEATVAHA